MPGSDELFTYYPRPGADVQAIIDRAARVSTQIEGGMIDAIKAYVGAKLLDHSVVVCYGPSFEDETMSASHLRGYALAQRITEQNILQDGAVQ